MGDTPVRPQKVLFPDELGVQHPGMEKQPCLGLIQKSGGHSVLWANAASQNMIYTIDI